jgi:hypothetical protein
MDLTVTSHSDPAVVVDNLEVAEFVSQMLEYTRVRNALDAISTKFVLILGRFTKDRKAILATIRDQVRKSDLLPITVECTRQTRAALPGAVELFSRMSQFILVDFTEPDGVPDELTTLVAGHLKTPIQPIHAPEPLGYRMFAEKQAHPSVMDPFVYENRDHLLEAIESVFLAVEEKAKELRV